MDIGNRYVLWPQKRTKWRTYQTVCWIVRINRVGLYRYTQLWVEAYNRHVRRDYAVSCCCGFINGSSSCSIEYWFPVEAGPCQEGYYCPNGTLLPIPCPDNTMKNYTGGYGIASDCTPCLAGKFCLNGNWLVIKGYSVLSSSSSSSSSSL